MTEESAINQIIRGLPIRPGEIIVQKDEVLEGRVEEVHHNPPGLLRRSTLRLCRPASFTPHAAIRILE